ncbi:PadR family transcriptional regulator [Pseudonocardia nigra]|uniref:PadR family transcriptional regulator n=1 Tax=Pseudonocardia nigra TaxID=1921578 RepID=UPI001C5FDF8C|nr:PadR family transcriptional regulator [Pseudonocardia nigra]
MKFEHVLLGLLSMRPYSGYAIRQWLETEGRFLRSRVHLSQIYRLLGRMVDDGWVEFEVDPREGRPDAKVYRLTTEGRRVLLEWVRGPYEPTSRFSDPDFSARFLFTAALDRDAAIELVKTELVYRRNQVAGSRGRDLTVHLEDPIPELDPERTQLAVDLTHGYGRDAVDHWMDWLESTLRRLEGDGA